MNVFTEEVLGALQKGANPTERINNALQLLILRDTPAEELNVLLSDIKKNCQNYRSWIWIADSIEGFVCALKNTIKTKTIKVNPIAADTPIIPNPLLSLPHNTSIYLYNELKSMSYISTKTTSTDFIFVFSGGVCPDGFTAIKWLKSKQALFELLRGLVNPVSNEIKRNAGILFSNNIGLIGKLSNPKTNQYSINYQDLQRILAKISAHQ